MSTKFKSILISSLVTLSWPAKAFAAQSWTGLEETDVATIQSLESVFGNVVLAVMGFVGIALFLMLTVGGFKFLFSGGDQKQLEAAHGTMTNAILGVILIVAAYLILRTIGVFTGIGDLITDFTIPK